jgi:diguanylate cyclase (GGDEF)-like protein/hemerythrin-like metal-binding protein/PAS domain S-box-containing protein
MELKKRIDAALFRDMVAGSAIPLIGSAVGSLLVAIAQVGSNQSSTVILWLCLVYATLGIRFWLSRRCRVQFAAQGYDQQSANRYALSIGLSGLAWGMAGLLIIGASPLAMIVTITAIQAMVMGGVLMLGAFIPAFLFFALPAMLPMIVILALSGGVANIVLALYSAIFLTLMIGIALRVNQSLRHTWHLTFEKEDLVKSLTEAHSSLKASQAIAGLGSYVLDIVAGIWKSSDILDQIFGIDPAYERSIPGWEQLIHPDDRGMMMAYLQNEVTGKGNAFEKEYRIIRHNDQSERWLHGMGKLEFDAQGHALRMIGTIQDITERKRVALELSIAAIAFETREGLMVTDANKVIMRVNHAFTNITGYLSQEAIGLTPHLLNSGHHDANFYAAMWNSIQRSGAWQGEIWNRRKNGELYPEQLTITAVTGSNNGEITHYVATMNDITERKQVDEQIQNLAFHDVLTGLPNRRLLNDRLRQMLTFCKRTGHFGALMFLDLDNFKPLNDMHGHAVGDLLLIEAARRIQSCVRETDTVARYGGDEFVVMLSELEKDAAKSTGQVCSVAEKLRATLAEPYMLSAQSKTAATIRHFCTASIGVMMFNQDASQENILRCADMAMYQAKEDGRNRVRFFDLQRSVAGSGMKILHLNWHESYQCGEPVIDSQHRKMFELANKLIESVFTRNEYPLEFSSALERLLLHIVQHFNDEEAILLKHHYIDYQAHANEHKALIERALELRDTADNISIGELMNFLANDVVAQHLLKTDLKFFPLFK